MTVLQFRPANVRPKWWNRAACLGMGPDKFFCGGPQTIQLSICARCPVKEICLEEALKEEADSQRWVCGTRGGMTAAQRVLEIRRRRKSLKVVAT